MIFSLGLFAGIILMKALEYFSPPFKEDLIAQEIVYEKGYKQGYEDAAIDTWA